jgi:hypothetical protein
MALSSLQTIATNLAHSEKRPPKISVAPGVVSISIEGRQLDLGQWRAGLQQLLEDTKT